MYIFGKLITYRMIIKKEKVMFKICRKSCGHLRDSVARKISQPHKWKRFKRKVDKSNIIMKWHELRNSLRLKV